MCIGGDSSYRGKRAFCGSVLVLVPFRKDIWEGGGDECMWSSAGRKGRVDRMTCVG